MIQQAIATVVERRDLTGAEMTAVMQQVMDGTCTPAQIAAFLTGLRMKGETAEELAAAARVMRQKALGIPLANRAGLVDIVGTGGDGAHIFNVSTAAAFVASAAGLRVAKHGNRSVSSRCGSADVMEALGVKITLSPEQVGRTIDEIGIGFLFAPVFHLAMKHAAPVRREIGVRTIFNMLGPLTNPADADIQLIGVYEARLAPLFAQVLELLGRKRALIVHGDDGLDEITLSGETLVYDLGPGGTSSYKIKPSDAGLPTAARELYRGDDAAANAEIITGVFKGGRGPCRDLVVLNAGAAIMAGGLAESIARGAALAAEAIDSGRALGKLAQLKGLTHSFS